MGWVLNHWLILVRMMVMIYLLFFWVERHYFVPKNMFLLPGNVAQCSGGAGQMLEMLHPRNMEYRPKQIQVNFTPFWCNLKDDLWKSGCCDLDSEWKKVVASSNDSLACALIDLGAFWSVLAHLPSKKLILPYFSSLSMVAVSVPFPWYEVEKGLRAV